MLNFDFFNDIPQIASSISDYLAKLIKVLENIDDDLKRIEEKIDQINKSVSTM
ncbi:MAG: hypothetical protein QXI58_04685 [Candidatus Micrarchaeia archaeon]